MLARTEPACLVIADIAGYTGYLAGVELDHAQDILGDLIDTVVGALRPAFKLAKLEGDAAFVYLPAATVDGPGFQDVIERCYFAFQRRLRDVRQASTCECNACVRMPDLDLKFVAHHGTIARQRMAGMEELVGTDVIVVHRLLKNHVAEDLDLPAYVLYSQAMTDSMNLRDPIGSGMREHRETYETVGEVVGWVTDLGAAWAAARERERIFIAEDEAFASITTPVRADQAVTWEWATSPIRRISWTPGMTDLVEETAGGRRGPGTVNHCVHGNSVTIEEVLDWQPPHYATKRNKLPIRGVPRILMTMELIPRGDLTDIVWRVGRPRSAKDRLILKAMEGEFRRNVGRDMAQLVPLAEADAALRAAGRADEPPVPVSAGRFITEPVGGPIEYVHGDSSREPVDSGTVGSSSA